MKIYKFLLLICSSCILFYSTGCISYSGSLEHTGTKIANPEKIKFPAKLYVKTYQENTPFLSLEERRNFNRNFCKYFPELFSATPENALQINIKFVNKQQSSSASFTEILGAAATFMTLGIAPAMQDVEYKVALEIEIENINYSADAKFTNRARAIAGILGFVGTRYLLPDLKKSWFYSESMLPHFLVREECRKDFLQFIVDAIYRIPPEKLQQLYNVKDDSESIFLSE
jgi:hypothetical protein